MADEHPLKLLSRIAESLERLSPPPRPKSDLSTVDAFVWHAEGERLAPVESVNRLDLELLKGISQQSGILLDNTRRFAKGLPANNSSEERRVGKECVST